MGRCPQEVCKLPKERQRLVFSDNQITLKDVQDELVNERIIKDTSDLRETFEIRARCFHMLKVCEFDVCRKLTERYTFPNCGQLRQKG